MSASSKTRSRSGPVLPISGVFQRSISPTGRFSSTFASSSSSFSSAASTFASSSSSFSSRSSTFFRSTSPTRVNLVGGSPSTRSVYLSIDRPRSPNGRSIAVSDRAAVKKPIDAAGRRRTCMCSPTTHPGSFRCSLHKPHQSTGSVSSYPSNRLNARRSAMTNSLVRIGTVEGDLVRRALAALIRPSSHQQRRRGDFQPRPSRLSVVSNAAYDLK